jgi:hypothetical protein
MLRAQSGFGIINGAVTDQGNYDVVNAHITVTNRRLRHLTLQEHPFVERGSEGFVFCRSVQYMQYATEFNSPGLEHEPERPASA